MPHQSNPPSQTNSIIRALHAGAGAHVVFMARQGVVLQTIGACPVDGLEHHAATLESLVDGDLYLSINSMRPQKQMKNGFCYARRTCENVTHLNAAFVDLDCRNVGLTPPEAAQAIVDAVSVGVIPQPSALVYSGRGVYVLWLLRDPSTPTVPPAATLPAKRLQTAINEAIINRLRHVGADPSAKDPARVFRVDGSINSKCGRIVEWHLLRDEEGEVFTYALDELAAWFNVDRAPKPRFYGRRSKQPGSAPNRKNGEIQKHLNILADMEAIETERGGIKQGKRYNWLKRYSESLQGAQIESVEALKRAEAMAARCVPSFPTTGAANDVPVSQIVKAAFEAPTVNTSVDALLIEFELTDDDVRRLELQTIVTPNVKAEREAEKKSKQRGAEKERRLAAMRAFVDETPTASASDVLSALKSQGFSSSATTVKRELAAMFPEREKQKAGRRAVTVQPSIQSDSASATTYLSISKGFGPIKSAPVFAVPVDVSETAICTTKAGRAEVERLPTASDGLRPYPSAPGFVQMVSSTKPACEKYFERAGAP